MKTIQRNYLINVVVSQDKDIAIKMLSKCLVAAGFTAIASDAKKIISKSIYDVELDGCFFVAVSRCDLGKCPVIIVHKLMRMALSGIPVFITSRNVPVWACPFCNVIYPE